jgi:hypothetical protein
LKNKIRNFFNYNESYYVSDTTSYLSTSEKKILEEKMNKNKGNIATIGICNAIVLLLLYIVPIFLYNNLYYNIILFFISITTFIYLVLIDLTHVPEGFTNKRKRSILEIIKDITVILVLSTFIMPLLIVLFFNFLLYSRSKKKIIMSKIIKINKVDYELKISLNLQEYLYCKGLLHTEDVYLPSIRNSLIDEELNKYHYKNREIKLKKKEIKNNILFTRIIELEKEIIKEKLSSF